MIAVYCRVSTEDQQERKTIENQISFAEKYCDLHELKLFKIYKEDGVSGTIPLEDRPQGKQLIKDAKNNKFDTLLLYKLDRLGRSARITLNSIHLLEQLNVQIKSMTEPFDTSSPSGRFMITMLAGVADLERSTILERMQLGTNRAAKEGKWLGGIVPYGYYVNEDKYLEVNTTIIPGFNLSEADIIKLIFKLTTENNYSCVKIADYLNSLNIPTSYKKDNRKLNKGKRKVSTSGIWRPGNILRMLHNKTYMGIHEYGKRSTKKREIIPRKVPAIVTEKVWNKAQEVIKDNIIEATRNHKRNYLLKGLIRCGLCNRTYVGITYGKKYYYVCNGKISYGEKCNSKNINGKYIENMIWNDITEFINNPGETINILKENLKTKDSNKQDLINQKELLETNLRAKETEKQSILDLFRKGIITATDVELQLSKIQEEFNNIHDNLNDIKNKLNEMQNILDYTKVDEMLRSMKLTINKDIICFEYKRQIVKTLVDKITVTTTKEGNTKKATLDIKYSFAKVETHTDNHVNNNLDIVLTKNMQNKYNYNAKGVAGNRIRKCRLEKSLTIKELSIQSGAEKNTLSCIELGKHIPTIKTLKKLEKVLNKPFWWLGGYDTLEENTLGKRIYKCRLMHGYTQKEFANILSVQKSTLTDWEKDKNNPNSSNFEKLKTCLDILIKK